MDEENKVKLGWLGLMDEVFTEEGISEFYTPVIGVEDKFWRLSSTTRISILQGWADAIEVLIDGNEVYGREIKEPEELSSAVIIKFPSDNV